MVRMYFIGQMPFEQLPDQKTGRCHQGVFISRGRTPSSAIWQPTTSHWTKQLTWLRTTLCGGWYLFMAVSTPSGACQKRRRCPSCHPTNSDKALMVTQSTHCNHGKSPSGLNVSLSINGLHREGKLFPLHWLYLYPKLANSKAKQHLQINYHRASQNNTSAHSTK